MVFNGDFNDDVRQLLRLRRNTLGLSCAQMAKKLGVNWYTYRKWETGATTRCNTKYTARLEALFNDDCDWCVIEPVEIDSAFKSDKAVTKTLSSLGITCSLVGERPELSSQLRSRLEQAFERAISAVLSTN